MKDSIIIPGGSVLPAYKIEGGEFEITLTSKTGKKKVSRGHNEVTEHFQKMATAPQYFGAFPWQTQSNGLLNNLMTTTAENVNWSYRLNIRDFIQYLFGVEALGETASGTDRYFKGTKLTGVAVSQTQSSVSDMGIIQSYTNTRTANQKLQIQVRWLFGQGKGTGNYDILYIPMLSRLSDSLGGTDSIYGANIYANALSSGFYNDYNLRLYTPHQCWGYGKRLLFSYMSGGSVNYFDMDAYDENSPIYNAGTASLARFAKPVIDEFWFTNTKVSEFGFGAITSPAPLNVQTKQYTASDPYNVQIYNAIKSETRYLNISEFGANYLTLVGQFRQTKNRYVYKFRNYNAINGLYYYANVIVDMEDGEITNAEYNIVTSSATAEAGFGSDVMYISDYTVDRDCEYSVGSPRMALSIDDMVNYPIKTLSQLRDEKVFGVSISDFKLFSWASEIAAMNGSNMAQGLGDMVVDDVPLNDIFRIGYNSGSTVITSKYHCPFFSCYNTGGITKEETDTMSILYTLNISGIDSWKQIINPSAT
jgi:hypothetical protein